MKENFKQAKLKFQEYEKKHGGFLQTDNVNLHYLEWGDPKNTPLIWVHGSYTNGYELRSIIEAFLAKEFYIIAIDYYGHGLTSIPTQEVSLYHVADDIEALMQFKKLDKAIIGGWSRGGIIATAFYDAYPEKVLGVILEDGGSVSTNTHYHKMEPFELEGRVNEIFREQINLPTFSSELEAYQFFYNQEEGGTQFELLAWLRASPEGTWTIGAGLKELFHMANKEQFLATVLRPTTASLFGESMAIIEPKIIYRNLSVPLLILDPTSENDIFPYAEENRQLKAQHPKLITYKVFEDTGHNIHYEHPKRFAETIIEFKQLVRNHWSK